MFPLSEILPREVEQNEYQQERDPAPEHELVLQGRLPGQAPEIDPVVYLTDVDPETVATGSFRCAMRGTATPQRASVPKAADPDAADVADLREVTGATPGDITAELDRAVLDEGLGRLAANLDLAQREHAIPAVPRRAHDHAVERRAGRVGERDVLCDICLACGCPTDADAHVVCGVHVGGVG